MDNFSIECDNIANDLFTQKTTINNLGQKMYDLILEYCDIPCKSPAKLPADLKADLIHELSSAFYKVIVNYNINDYKLYNEKFKNFFEMIYNYVNTSSYQSLKEILPIAFTSNIFIEYNENVRKNIFPPVPDLTLYPKFENLYNKIEEVENASINNPASLS